LPKTHRSNEPVKRAHWHSARTERRGREAHGWFWAEDEDLAFRSRGGTRLRGRAVANGVWLTADKSRVRWLLENGRIRGPRASWLTEKLRLKNVAM